MGHGAQIVVLLDRSRSMDESFNQGRANTTQQAFDGAGQRDQGQGCAPNFGGICIQANPGHVRHGRIQLTPDAHSGLHPKTRGHSGSHTAPAMSDEVYRRPTWRAGYFPRSLFSINEPYTGSRIILTGIGWRRSNRLMKPKQRLALQMRTKSRRSYWIYLRSFHSPGLYGVPSHGTTAIRGLSQNSLCTNFSVRWVPLIELTKRKTQTQYNAQYKT